MTALAINAGCWSIIAGTAYLQPKVGRPRWEYRVPALVACCFYGALVVDWLT